MVTEHVIYQGPNAARSPAVSLLAKPGDRVLLPVFSPVLTAWRVHVSTLRLFPCRSELSPPTPTLPHIIDARPLPDVNFTTGVRVTWCTTSVYKLCFKRRSQIRALNAMATSFCLSVCLSVCPFVCRL